MKSTLLILSFFFVLLVGTIGFENLSAKPNVNNTQKQFPIDFSCVGYEGVGVSIPQVNAVFSVKPTGGDDTELLQTAIDTIGNLPIDDNGFRGALQLSNGQFKIAGQLKINQSGIVIRGAGKDKKSVLVATGNDRRTLIQILPNDLPLLGKPIDIVDSIVPAGAISFTVNNIENLNIGNPILITRPCTQEWIHDIGMNKKEGTFAAHRGLHWPVGSRVLQWDRKIISINSATQKITIDAPITTALKEIYGGGTIQKVTQNNTISNIGMENLELESEFDPKNLMDEEHAWLAVAIDHAKDCWLNGITAKHFVSSLVHVGHHAKRISILNCNSEQPLSEPAGYRRQSFWIEGQQVLVQNCSADFGMNDFAIGLCAAGPNVFLNCTATNALGASGSFESWSSGTLYENVKIEGAGLLLKYDFDRAQGGGWTAANSVVWNCTANDIETTGPFSAPNQQIKADSSLYFSQLQQRLGREQNIDRFRNPTKSDFTGSKKLAEFTSEDIPAQKLKSTPPLQP
ncbi:MAG TPA: hypothetical protein VKA27_15845, partial [Sunxiuqinia sp.]|nr:hypothetical protein [Sunxiuqinia sp.]